MYFDSQRRKQPILLFYERFLKRIDQANEKNSKLKYISPSILLTENRKDIEYRCVFLKEVIEKKVSPFKTLYSQFIADNGKRIYSNPELRIRDFIKLFYDIKTNGIKEPIIVGKYNSKFIKTRYILNGQKIWKVYENKTGLQIMRGGHRLACALYLGIKEIPVKIYKPLLFEIPNYTDYIALKEKDYLDNLKLENGQHN